jgi:hypothetical protein
VWVTPTRAKNATSSTPKPISKAKSVAAKLLRMISPDLAAKLVDNDEANHSAAR